MAEEVKAALKKAGFVEDEIQLEETEAGNVGGFVISTQFTNQSQLERQEKLWADLAEHLSREQLRRIVSLLTMTPDEVDDDARTSHG